MTTNFTYSWKPVNNTDFAVCSVVASDELDTKVVKKKSDLLRRNVIVIDKQQQSERLRRLLQISKTVEKRTLDSSHWNASFILNKNTLWGGSVVTLWRG